MMQVKTAKAGKVKKTLKRSASIACLFRDDDECVSISGCVNSAYLSDYVQRNLFCAILIKKS